MWIPGTCVSALARRQSSRVVHTQSAAHGHVQCGANAIFQASLVIRSNTALVIGDLFCRRVLLETRHKVDNITVVIVELVTRAVEADDEGPGVFLRVLGVVQCAHRPGQSNVLDVTTIGLWCLRINMRREISVLNWVRPLSAAFLLHCERW